MTTLTNTRFKPYNEFRYLFPPRPEYKISPNSIATYDDGTYIAQPKYNGSSVTVFTNGHEVHVYNRHKELFKAANHKEVHFIGLALNPGKWYVFNGEYLNKGKLGEDGKKAKDIYIIWDVLVWEGQYLLGSTVDERRALLDAHFPVQYTNDEHILKTSIKGVCRVPSYEKGFKSLYEELVNVDLYEGLVFKKRHVKLEWGLTEKNNTGWQIKCRKPTKNYAF